MLALSYVVSQHIREGLIISCIRYQVLVLLLDNGHMQVDLRFEVFGKVLVDKTVRHLRRFKLLAYQRSL
jgi:hypothetical protein